MAAIKVFLDTDVLINWLAKEIDPQTGEQLWKASYQILKRIENGRLSGYTTLLNLMEIVFVLRRKKRWKEEKISRTVSKIQSIPHLTLGVPTDADIITAYNLQSRFPLGPFGAIYYAIAHGTVDYLVSRDKALIATVNQAESRSMALSPEDLLKKLKVV